MRAGESGDRRPGAVPDDPTLDAAVTEARWDVDTDGDGQPDTLLAANGPDLLVATDLDGDGLADRVLRIGPDGSVRTAAHSDPASWPSDDADDGPVTGHAPATPGSWGALLGRLLGLGP